MPRVSHSAPAAKSQRLAAADGARLGDEAPADEGGDVLTGWSFFQGFPESNQALEFEPNGYFRKRSWFADTLGIVVLTGNAGAPDAREVQRQTLERALTVMPTTRVRDTFAGGVPAFDAWIGSLLDDSQFVGDTEASRLKHRVHNDALGNLAEYRAYGGTFLRELAAGILPRAAEPLEQAASAYVAEGESVGRIIAVLGGFGYEDDFPRRLAQPQSRATIVPLIQQARALDEVALGDIEQAVGLARQ